MFKYLEKLVNKFGVFTGNCSSPLQSSSYIRPSFMTQCGSGEERKTGELQDFDLNIPSLRKYGVTDRTIKDIKKLTDASYAEQPHAGVVLYLFRVQTTKSAPKGIVACLVRQTKNAKNVVKPEFIKNYQLEYSAKWYESSFELQNILRDKLAADYNRHLTFA